MMNILLEGVIDQYIKNAFCHALCKTYFTEVHRD